MTERLVLSFGAGAAILSAVVFALCAAGLAQTPWLLLAAVVVAAATYRWRLGESGSGTGLDARVRVFLWAIVVPFAGLYLVNAAAPEISPDGAGYHLGLVRQYLDHGGFIRITTDFFASFPQGCEMLFLVAYSVGRHSAAALVHCLFLFALPAALVAYGRRFGMATAGMIAALLVFVSPVVGIDGSSAYVDVALAFAGFACFYALEIWGEQPEAPSRMLVVAGLLAGFAFAVKYTGATVIVFAAVYVLIRTRKPAALAALIAPALLVSVPWLIKNWVIVDNPFSPFFNRIFPNPFVYVSFEDDLRRAMRHLNGVPLGWSIVGQLTVGGGLLQGTTGPAFLLAPVGLAAVLSPRGRRVLAAGAVMMLPWFSNIGTRFLIPALPFIALAMAIALARWPRVAILIVLANAIACWPWVLSRYCDQYNWRLSEFPLAAAMRITPQREFIAARRPDIRYAELLQQQMPAAGVVYTAQPIMWAYTDRTILLNYTAALNQRLGDVLLTATNPAWQPSREVSFPVSASPRALRRVRFVVTGASGVWSVHEVEHATAALSNVNPWDAGLAVDGQLVTSWRTWQPAASGMYLEVTYPPGYQGTAVSYRTRGVDPIPPLRLDVEVSPGEWKTLGAVPAQKRDLPTPDLRSEAMAEFHRCGITHVFLHDQEPLGPDFQHHAADWKVDRAGEALPMRLYSIQMPETIDRAKELRNNTR